MTPTERAEVLLSAHRLLNAAIAAIIQADYGTMRTVADLREKRDGIAHELRGHYGIHPDGRSA